MTTANATGQEFLPQLEIDGPDRMSRLTVLFRLLLAIPHYVVLFFLGIAAGFVMLIGWFGALFMGRLPDWARKYLSGYLGWSIRVTSYTMLLVDRYPPFAFEADAYPTRVELQPGRLNRWAVFFRFILMIPAYFMTVFLNMGWQVFAFFFWIAVLITGRTPVPVFGSTAAVLRYAFRFQTYMMLLTSAYPKRVFGDPAAGFAPSPQAFGGETGGASVTGSGTWGTRPLVLTGGGRALLIIMIVLGVLGFLGSNAANTQKTTEEMREHGYQASVVQPG